MIRSEKGNIAFACGYLVFSEPFIKETILSPDQILVDQINMCVFISGPLILFR